MTSKELNFRLISLLPEIKSMYSDTVSWQEGDDTGSHIVFEDVFVPYVIECARTRDQIRLFKCFEVIEKMLSSNDEYAEEVVAVSVLESLLFEGGLIKELLKYMGEKTKRLLEEVRFGWHM